ncbi:DUF4397 domain-containing protein [Bacillaceae bacterium IKA-2]|nr:DUF4397 domain-containing protein [Bacillaceae bacterium IKA-2]
MYQQPFQPVNKLAQDAQMYDLLANYYKYLDPQKHIYYYQLHFSCMQQLCHTQAYPLRNSGGNPSHSGGQAKIRVLHASPDAPRVDVYINDEKRLENMFYYQITPYINLPAGTHQVQIYPAGQKNTPVLSENITIQSGSNYTVAAAGLQKELRLVSVVDTTAIPSGKLKARFLHLSANAPAVDIALAEGDVLFKNISFGNVSDYLELAPGTVTLEVRLAGTKDVVLTLRNTELKANQAYTITAIGLVDGTPRLEALILQP